MGLVQRRGQDGCYRTNSYLRFFAAILLGITGLFMGTPAVAIETETVTYRDGGVTMRGYRAYPDDRQDPRPGILIVHQWKGLGEYEKRRARQLARMGYVAFAGDIYGADTRPSTNHGAAMASSTFREVRNIYRKRAKLALEILRDDKRVRSDDLAAIGYCFGGTGYLNWRGPVPGWTRSLVFTGDCLIPRPRRIRAYNLSSRSTMGLMIHMYGRRTSERSGLK